MKYDAILSDMFMDMMLKNEDDLNTLARRMSGKALIYFDTSEIGLLMEEEDANSN